MRMSMPMTVLMLRRVMLVLIRHLNQIVNLLLLLAVLLLEEVWKGPYSASTDASTGAARVRTACW
jgi:hypothetical protein